MAAGLGFKDFATGEVLTAADVDGYLMQGIWVFASNAARDAAVTAPAEGNFAFTKDTNSLWYYDGAAWVASGATGDIEGVTAGVGISGGGTSGTVTVTNSMATAIDAKGDLIGGTGADTFSRLAVGANGTVLTADSAETTGLKWATPAGGASTLVLVKAPTSFSNVAGTGTTFDNVFTSTYTTYVIVVENIYGGTATDDFLFNLRYAGPSTQTVFYGSALKNSYDSTTYDTILSNGTDLQLYPQIGNSTATAATSYLTVQNAGSTNYPLISGFTAGLNNSAYFINNGVAGNSRLYTGFLLKSSSSNVTGTVAVYAYARS